MTTVWLMRVTAGHQQLIITIDESHRAAKVGRPNHTFKYPAPSDGNDESSARSSKRTKVAHPSPQKKTRTIKHALPHAMPARWRETYDPIRGRMRVPIHALVDTVG